MRKFPSWGKSLKDFLLPAIAFISCPCNVLLMLFLLPGSAAAAWVERYKGPVYGAMLAVSVVSICLMLRQMNRGGAEG